jgi:hypothetical protein
MVDFGGTCIGKAANSGTLTVGIRLSPTTPLEVIQQIRALVVDSPPNTETPIDQPAVMDGILRIKAAGSAITSGHVQPRFVRLIPVDATTSKGSSWVKLIVDAVSIPYYVVWTGVGILTFLGLIQPHIQEIKEAVTGLTVPFEQLIERVTKTLDEEQPQPTPKNEHQEKSGSPSVITSKGD